MRFLPREEKFFALFLDQVRYISEAAALLLQGAEAGKPHLEKAAEQIGVLERKADEVIHDVFRRLNQTFITPLDPEDIHSLSTHLDDVIDAIEEASHRMVIYDIEPIPHVVIEVCRNIVASASSLQAAFQALNSNQKILEHCIEINRIEDVTDDIVRSAVKDLFANEKDPIRIMKLKEIYELLEQATDYCEDVADALQNVVVKNS
jgi:predicted phosphate transport protein (TIGR00153 family)